MKPSRLNGHFTSGHPDKRCKELAYFHSLLEKVSNCQTLPSVMASEAQLERDALLASNRLPLMIAKSVKVSKTVLHQPARTIVSKISLSRRIVQIRMDAMAKD
ncbi:hypothetical protein M514_20383 [Trichuris suis]|uniref:Uncharacterized protein n=1 Tax=Trichuris suis TaxID=68888 RepID=A0A085ND01_9BILA|nr:hypothetical protein M514_20383 [Trichuris suis]